MSDEGERLIRITARGACRPGTPLQGAEQALEGAGAITLLKFRPKWA